MSFNELKTKHGTRVIQAVALYPNACKYSVDENINKGLCASNEIVNSSYTGVLSITESADSDVLFLQSANPYIKTASGEIAKITVDSVNQLTLTERGQFGTTASSIFVGEQLRIIHGGEADSSCRGYPQRPDGKGCSTNNSFDREVTREFLITDTQLVAGEIYFNGLRSISHSPTLLKPAEAMAKSASVNVSIQDNEDGDQYTVPYPNLRTNKSTLLRKLEARTGGFLRNRKMIVYSGFTENNVFDRNNCISREYIIDDFNISNNDNVAIRGVDPLMLAEEAKAKTHDISAGVLLADINDASTEITLKSFLPGEYGADTESGTVLIDSELIDYTVSNSAGGVLTIVNRGVAGSIKKDHKINASAQKCLTYENFNPVTAIVDRLQQRTNIEGRFFDDYTIVESKVLSNLGKIYITKPIAVKSFINDIIKTWSENNISLYFDELNKKIRIKASGDFEQQPITLTDVDFRIDSVDITNEYKEQITRASIGFAPFDASKKTDEENSSIIYQSINLQTELQGTLEANEEKTFYSQYLTDSDIDVGIAVGGVGRKANLNARPPQQYKFTIDYEKYGDIEGGKIEEGEIINVTTELSIDDDGQPRSENLQIISIKDDMKNKRVTVTAELYQDIINEADFDFIINESKEDYVLSDDFAPTQAGEYTVFIASNVTFGGVASFAFDEGAQAAGVTLKLIHRGSVLGFGGDGAATFDASVPAPDDMPLRVVNAGQDGKNGGDAINITVPTIIDTTSGVIYAGGGGAPSDESIADSTSDPVFVDAGNGGSGGQGYVGGKGGRGSTADVDGITSETAPDGVDGSRTSAGALAGIAGGAWGEDSDVNPFSGDAGKSGFAIRSNGNSVTIIGDNEATIRGRRDF